MPSFENCNGISRITLPSSRLITDSSYPKRAHWASKAEMYIFGSSSMGWNGSAINFSPLKSLACVGGIVADPVDELENIDARVVASGIAGSGLGPIPLMIEDDGSPDILGACVFFLLSDELEAGLPDISS